LTDIRSALVRGTNLAKVAKDLWLPDYLLLWKWEEMSWGRSNDYLLANVVEALLWAIYLDLGVEVASAFVDKYIYITLEDILKNNKTKDHKTIIQEYAQAEYEITPTYKIHAESWPDHDKTFEVGVYLNDKHIWTGTWSSKKKAQESAAQDWYNKIIK
jgi:ribonuclease-3